MSTDTVKAAVLRPQKTGMRSPFLQGLVFVMVLVTAIVLGVYWNGKEGLEVGVEFRSTHGLKVGDEVKLESDNVVGIVTRVEPLEDLSGSLVTVRLSGSKTVQEMLARQGTEWYIVRSAFGGPDFVRGAETIIGAKYLVAIPGQGSRQQKFVGLDEMPVVRQRHPDDLILRLTSASAHSVSNGAALTYRGIRVGTVLSQQIAPDANRVVTHVLIRRDFAPFVDQASRFFILSGVQLRMGLSGLDLKSGSLESLLTGGIGFSTPPSRERRGRAHENFEFELHAEPEDAWLSWQPNIDLEAGRTDSVSTLEASLSWERRLRGSDTRIGRVIPTSFGLLGFKEIFKPDPEWTKPYTLNVGGTFVPNTTEKAWESGDLCLMKFTLPETPLIDGSRFRHAASPEICIVHGPKSTARLELGTLTVSASGSWSVAGKDQFDPSWHGSFVTGVSDGKVIGLLNSRKDPSEIVLIPEDAPFFTK